MSDMYSRMYNRAQKRVAGQAHVKRMVRAVELKGSLVGGVALVDAKGNELLVLDPGATAILAGELNREARSMQKGIGVEQRLAGAEARAARYRNIPVSKRGLNDE